MIKQIILLLLSISTIYNLNGQTEVDLRSHAIATLEPVSDPEKPGVSAAIVQDGKVIFSQASGLANLATGAVANENTIYQVDYLARQFTTYGFLQLIESGAINADDDIRQYISELPQYDSPITVKHVLNHTTGLNNFYVVQAISRASASNGLTNDGAIKLISAQKELPTPSGTSFSSFTSATESLLMAVIIATVSEMSFAEYMEQNVFTPLGLNDTRFIDNNQIILKNAAIAYQNTEGKMFKGETADNIVGPTNLFISIRDISKWYTLFSPKSNEPFNKEVKKLDTPVRNDIGDPNVNPWGEMTIGRSHLHLERGIPKYWQYGMTGSYCANVFRFPELDLTAIALGNNDAYNGNYAMPIVSPLTEQHFKVPATGDPTPIKTHSLTTNEIEQWNGEYYNPVTGQVRKFEMQNDTLRYIRRASTISLLPISEQSFQAMIESDDKLKFHFGKKNGERYYDISSFGEDRDRYNAIDPNFTLDEEGLQYYSGTYINKELGQIYSFAVKDNKLTVNHNYLEDTQFKAIKKDHFVSNDYALSTIQFHSTANEVTHFTLRASDITHLSFQKVK